MNILTKHLGLPLVSGIAMLCTVFTVQAQNVDPEWPCIQRLILEVSPAVMWPVPVEDDSRTQYRRDSTIRALAEELGDIEVFSEVHQQSIIDFADSVSESEREQQLTLLATGIIDVSNRVRGNYIRGIKRFTRQQIAISEQIEDTLNQLSLIEVQGENDNTETQQEIKETLRWHERVYDQRERSIQLLCDAPVDLEQQLSEVLRYTAQYLP